MGPELLRSTAALPRIRTDLRAEVTLQDEVEEFWLAGGGHLTTVTGNMTEWR
jgi:hypothetical protein